MWQTYLSILILLAIIGVSSFKIHQHKDDEDVTNLAIYSSITGVSSLMVIYFIYTLWVRLTPRDKVIDAVLNDFLKINKLEDGIPN